MKTYIVEQGVMCRENGGWTNDGMVETHESAFATIEEARAAFDEASPEDDYSKEWAAASVKPRDKGYYAQLWEVEDDGDFEEREPIDWKQYTADDYAADE